MAYRQNSTAIGIYAAETQLGFAKFADCGFAVYDRDGCAWRVSARDADEIAARVADTAERKRDKGMAR